MGPFEPAGTPVRKPFLNLRETVFRYRMRPVPTVFLLFAFSPQLSAITILAVRPTPSPNRKCPARLEIFFFFYSFLFTYIFGFWQRDIRRTRRCASGYGENDDLEHQGRSARPGSPTDGISGAYADCSMTHSEMNRITMGTDHTVCTAYASCCDAFRSLKFPWLIRVSKSRRDRFV